MEEKNTEKWLGTSVKKKKRKKFEDCKRRGRIDWTGEWRDTQTQKEIQNRQRKRNLKEL
jgi:hypothetical protein